jgi:hypothetical protein
MVLIDGAIISSWLERSDLLNARRRLRVPDLYAGSAQFVGQAAVANPVKRGAKGPSCGALGALAEDDLLVFNLDPLQAWGRTKGDNPNDHGEDEF